MHRSSNQVQISCYLLLLGLCRHRHRLKFEDLVSLQLRDLNMRVEGREDLGIPCALLRHSLSFGDFVLIDSPVECW